MQRLSERRGLSGFQLKMIAAALMVLDHGCKVFAPYLLLWVSQILDCPMEAAQRGLMLFSLPGRISFPIFAFCTAQGAGYTGDIRRYLGRMFFFALISEFPYQLMVCQIRGEALSFHLGLTNVIFTLFLGVAACVGWKWAQGRSFVLSLLLPLGAMALAELLGTDYGGLGVLMVYVCYRLPESKRLLGLAGVLFLEYGVSLPMRLAQASMSQGESIGEGLLYLAFSFLSLLPLKNYDGTAGKGKAGRLFFYWFYPLHIGLAVLLRVVLESLTPAVL